MSSPSASAMLDVSAVNIWPTWGVPLMAGRPPALSAENMQAVRGFLGNGGSVSAAARAFGVSRPTVRAVRDGIYGGQHDIT